MPTAISPLATRAVYQWEWDSTSSPPPDPGNAPFNCGPCSVTKILEFYFDRDFNVNNVRRTAASDLRATNVSEQLLMMERNGLDGQIMAMSIDQLTQLLSDGRRPVLIGLDMSKVPLAVAGHTFRGPHAFAAMVNTIRSGVRGKLLMDPNFSPRTGRIDPTGGKRFYPDYIINAAMASPATQRWGVVPKAPKKVVLDPVETGVVAFNRGVNGVNLRNQPDSTKDNVFAIAYADPKGIIRVYNGQRLANTGDHRNLYDVVRGPDGQLYNKLRLPNVTGYVFTQSRFMHRVR